jgi:5-methylcytosine-specific restriction protein A
MLKDIKISLESAFDIPFHIEKVYSRGVPCVRIYPDNDEESLFYLDVFFKENLRIIIEAYPQRFAAGTLADISSSNDGKRIIASLYASELLKKNAKVDFRINDLPVTPNNYSTWPQEWQNFNLRVTKMPVEVSGSIEENQNVIIKWSKPVIGIFLSLLYVEPVSEQFEEEGSKTNINVNRYERSKINRELCLIANGYSCKICGFNFESKYGLFGRGYIHVHHKIPVSKMDKSYMVNPITDLIPVCPNCHAMLHRNDPPIEPEVLIEIIRKNAKI